MDNTDRMILDYFNGKRVFITGHTGFKGAWLSELLLLVGAEVCGYALSAAEDSLFQQLQLAERGEAIQVRNPASILPYRHVLEPLSAYLLIAKAQCEVTKKAGSYNVGPDVEDCLTTGELAELFCRCWGKGACWKAVPNRGPREMRYLRLDCAKIKSTLGWIPRWSAGTAVEKTVGWTKEVLSGQDAGKVTHRQIQEYFAEWEDKSHG